MTSSKPIGVVVGASSEAVYALEQARKLGLETIAVDGSPAAEGLAAADRAIVTDIRDPRNILTALGAVRPAAVIPVPIGRYLISGAALNDAYGLPGVSRAAAELCTDKLAFHQALAPVGLRPGGCALLKTAADAPAQPPLPAILKPRCGSGSRGVVRLNTAAALDAALAALDGSEEMLLEPAAPGTEYGMDAAVFGGAFTPVLLRKKINTPPPDCQCVGYYSVSPTAPEFAAAAEQLRRVALALGVDNAVLHADLMICDGVVYPIEVSARPSGHNLHNVFTPFVTGVDLVREYLCAALGRDYDFAPRQYRGAFIRFFDFAPGTVEALPDPAELRRRYPLAAYRCALRPGERLGPVHDGSVMHRGYFVLEGGSEVELTDAAQRLLAEFRLSPV